MSESTLAAKREFLSRALDAKRSRGKFGWPGKRSECGSAVGRVSRAPSVRGIQRVESVEVHRQSLKSQHKASFVFQSVVFLDCSISLHNQIACSTENQMVWNKKNHIQLKPPFVKECDISYYYNTINFSAKPASYSCIPNSSHLYFPRCTFLLSPRTIAQYHCRQEGPVWKGATLAHLRSFLARVPKFCVKP
jgi:hypothetical protein